LSPFVLDASVSGSWIFPDEFDPLATRAFEALGKGSIALTPAIWWFELRNTIIVGERRLRLTIRDSEVFLDSLSKFDIRVQETPADADRIFTLARRHGLTFYDATYLALAIEEGAPMATLDKALAKAAAREGVELLS
jgi:predicted nucleic acid-binding protein